MFFLAAVVFAQPPGPVDTNRTGYLPTWVAKRAISIGIPIDCSAVAGEWRHSVGGAEILVRRDEEIVVRGRSRSGGAWRVEAGYPGDGGCRFVAHDLDRNGFVDLIFLTANGGSGPNGVTMTVVAFDRMGRPVPWQATGPFVLEGDRILQVVDLDADGKAELLFPYVELGEDGLRSDFAVMVSLYTISEGYFRRVEGTFAGRKFPVENQATVRLTDDPDLTNGFPATALTDRIDKIQRGQATPCWLEGISVIGDGIVLAPSSAAALECLGQLRLRRGGKIPIPLIVVVDLPKEGRVVDINHSSGEQLLRRAVSLKMAVVFAGRTCETGCRPLIMWARRR